MSGNQGLIDIKSQIGIINQALDFLSIDYISDISIETKTSKVMRYNFQIAKESILREWVFDWAHKAEKLVPYADDKGGYEEPADYINYIGLGDECNFCCCSSGFKNLAVYSHKSAVRKVNGRLYIDSCCCDKYEWFHYSFNNQNYSDIPADLFECISLKLACLTCNKLINNEQRFSQLQQRLNMMLERASAHAGLEHKILNNHEPHLYPLRPKCGGFY